jgi:glycosyltransferase involved in cell wall biosynthesis
LKIVIVGSAHPLRGGGISTFNERLASALGSNAEVIIYSFKLQYPNFLFPGKNQFTDEPAPPGLTIKSVINSINPLNWIKVGRMLRKEQADIIIVRYWLPFMGPAFGTILRIAGKNKRTKIISILDNVIPHEKRVGDVAFTKYFLKPIDGFVSMSREVLTDLRKFESKKPAVYAPHPVYDNYGDSIGKAEAQALLGIAPTERCLLFFGFIRDYKGLDILLEAMAEPSVRELGIKLMVAGEYYGNQAKYEQLIDRLGIREQLYLFTDFIPNDEVYRYFSAADVVVQPYRTATQSGISQIAYHFEKPMIVTAVGGLPEIVPHNKVGLVTAVESKAIAAAIVTFYTEDKGTAFSQNLKLEKAQYSWSHFTKKIMQLGIDIGVPSAENSFTEK